MCVAHITGGESRGAPCQYLPRNLFDALTATTASSENDTGTQERARFCEPDPPVRRGRATLAHEMAPTISRGNHIARVERFAQKSRVLRGCPQKYTLILTCGLQNYFSEKSLRRSRKAENFSDDCESAYEVVYISRRFLSDRLVSGPASRRRRLLNRRGAGS